MTYCITPKGYRRYRCPHGTLAWLPLRCRQCDGCGQAHAMRVAEDIAWGVEQTGWAAMLTLTTRPLEDGSQWDWSVIMRRFQSLMKATRRVWGRVEYAAVKEEGTRSGMRHLHVVLVGCKWIPQEWLSEMWYNRTGAWSVDIRRVGAGVSRYVAKYLSKGGRVAKKNVSYSKGYPRRPRESLLELEPDIQDGGVTPEAETVEERARARGWTLTRGGNYIEQWSPEGTCDCFGPPLYPDGSGP